MRAKRRPVVPDLERLEARILELMDEGSEARMEDLRCEFPRLDEADIERVRSSAQILNAWLGELGGDLGEERASQGDWLEPGTRIGGYVVLRRIPGGGMGQVYQAVQESLYPRQVALKVYRLGAAPKEELSRARREAEIASRMLHSHLVAIHDMGHDETRGLAFFSMQYVDGPDLRAELCEKEPRSRRFEVRRLVTRVSEIAGALAELHRRGYVHRDVKPENILLRRTGGRDGHSEAAVLVDFGLVRAERALGVRQGGGRTAGTPGYIPPEAEGGDGPVTPAWDVYSLGVVLYELLRGRPLARDERGAPQRPTRAELAALRRSAPAVDRNLLAVVQKAAHEHPALRYPDAGAMQRDLERWLAGEFVSARRPSIPERLWRSAGTIRRRTLVLLLLLSLAPLSLWEIGRTIRSARHGLAEIAQGDLVGGWESLASVTVPYLRVLLQGQGQLQRDLVEGTALDPITQVVSAARQGGPAASFELAAAFLQREGLHTARTPNHPELQAYLLRGLRFEEVRTQALKATARLFFESPIEDRETLELARPIRDRLIEMLAGPLPASDGLHAAHALGGLGSPADLAPLLEWMESRNDDPEAFRMGLASSERIVRRSRLVEGQQELGAGDWERIEERTGALAQRWLSSAELDRSIRWPLLASWARWIEAWALFHRAANGQAPPTLLGRWPGGPWYLDWTVRAALAGEDAELRRWLEQGPPLDGLDRIVVRDLMDGWGRVCALLGCEALRATIEERLARTSQGSEPDDPALLENFRSGWKDGAACLLEGPNPSLLPDADSHLRHLIEPGSSSELELEMLRGEHNPGAGTLACWDFKGKCSGAGSEARFRVGGGTSWKEHASGRHFTHLRLPRPGAWVEVTFTLDPGADARHPSVVIRHLAAQRPYVPHEGQAWIRVELDGKTLAERLLVEDPGRETTRLGIDRRSLGRAGPHRLRVTLVEATTTYWLEELRIEQEP